MVKNKETKNKEWISYLDSQIDEELDKSPDEQDWNKVKELLHSLDEATRGTFDLDPVVKAKKKEQIKKLYTRKKANRRWLPVTVAAALVLLVMAVPVASATFKNLSLTEAIKEWGKEWFNIPEEEQVERGGITIIKNGKEEVFANQSDFLKHEKINILYPTWLPNSAEIEDIYVWDNNTRQISIVYDFSDERLSYTVKNVQSEGISFAGRKEYMYKIEDQEIMVGVLELDGKIDAIFEFEDRIYRIGVQNIIELNKVIAGLKENLR